MSDLFEVSGGSIIGMNHKGTGMNNQDAFLIDRIDENNFIMMVSDGCGSERDSEVGAKLGIRIFSKTIKEYYQYLDSMNAKEFIELIADMSSFKLSNIAEASGIQDDLASYFLFTLLGGITTPKSTILFSLGDGIFIINGVHYKQEPFDNNSPAYLGYRDLIKSSFKKEDLKFNVMDLETSDIENLLIGTDGVNYLINSWDKTIPGKDQIIGNISQFWENDIYFTNPMAIHHRLNLINRHHCVTNQNGSLEDDTTFVVARRRIK